MRYIFNYFESHFEMRNPTEAITEIQMFFPLNLYYVVCVLGIIQIEFNIWPNYRISIKTNTIPFNTIQTITTFFNDFYCFSHYAFLG